MPAKNIAWTGPLPHRQDDLAGPRALASDLLVEQDFWPPGELSMQLRACLGFVSVLTGTVAAPLAAVAEERTERFDRDPGWDASNNRSNAIAPRKITQDFGFSRTQHAGGDSVGEIGGVITPAAEPAYYAKVIPTATLADKLVASGKLAYRTGPGHLLIGFMATNWKRFRSPNPFGLPAGSRFDAR